MTVSPTPGPAGRASATAPARVLFLGTGTSHGVPMIGCTCDTCQSTDPRDRRLRPSIYLDVPGYAQLLVDTSTDLRQQALTHQIRHVDAVLFTHAHADHVMGFDEVRRFNLLQGIPIPCYADARTWGDLRHTFHYVFGPAPTQGGGVPQLTPHTVEGPFTASGVQVVPVPLWHGRMPILGYRFGTFAYLTDCNGIPDDSWALLDGVQTLVIDGLRFRPHSSHYSVDEAIDVVRRIGPARALLTHICHDISHATHGPALPAGVELAYDGLALDVTVDVE